MEEVDLAPFKGSLGHGRGSGSSRLHALHMANIFDIVGRAVAAVVATTSSDCRREQCRETESIDRLHVCLLLQLDEEAQKEQCADQTRNESRRKRKKDKAPPCF